eukprot:1802052-Rhodomonas_salina.3
MASALHCAHHCAAAPLDFKILSSVSSKLAGQLSSLASAITASESLAAVVSVFPHLPQTVGGASRRHHKMDCSTIHTAMRYG